MTNPPARTFGLPPYAYLRALGAGVLPDMSLLKLGTTRRRSPANEISLILEKAPTPVPTATLSRVDDLLRWPFYTQDTFGRVGEHPTCVALKAHLKEEEPLSLAAQILAHELHGISVWNPQGNRYDTPIRLPDHLKDASQEEQVKAAKTLWESRMNR